MTGLKKPLTTGPDYLKGIIRQICESVRIPSGPFYDQTELHKSKGIKVCVLKSKRGIIQYIEKNRLLGSIHPKHQPWNYKIRLHLPCAEKSEVIAITATFGKTQCNGQERAF